MVISKIKAGFKAINLLQKVHEDMADLEEKGMGYTHILCVPSGSRLVRYSRKAGLKLRCGYLIDVLIFVHFEEVGRKVWRDEYEAYLKLIREYNNDGDDDCSDCMRLIEEDSECSEFPEGETKIYCLCKCGKNDGTEDLHSCPYQSERNNDSSEYCNCCDDCLLECVRQI